MQFKLVSDENRHVNLNIEAINTYTSRWKPHTSFEFEIVKRQPRKSDPLRKYYFKVVVRTYADGLGYEVNEIMLFHRQLKIVYFQVEPDKKGIYRDSQIPSVFSDDSKVPVSEKWKFVEWVKRCAARDGFYIPDPVSKEELLKNRN
jgi:hypothetical protein